MEQELWLSRDNGESSHYNIHNSDPGTTDDLFWGQIVDFCPRLFHKYVQGARLRKGRKRKIKRILIELED